MKISILTLILIGFISCSTKTELIKNEWIKVEGGEFIMGCHDSADYFCKDDEKPSHKVHVGDFFISKYEVTVREYKEFCDSTEREMPKYKPEWGWIDNHPIVCVTHEDALAYAEWKGARLPTEQEWEYASKGGISSHDYRYSGSDDISEVGLCNTDSKKQTERVGLRKPNELGIYDMSGNVNEWCSNRFYPYDSLANNQFPNHLVIRGGSFADPESSCRNTSRTLANYGLYNYWLGFRIVKDFNED